MEQQTFQQVVGLGSTCRAKHHIKRIIGKYVGRRGVLDWQVTPTDALFAYLRQDLRGMFERPDLAIERGLVFNTKYGVEHTHEFPRGLDDEELGRLYPIARASHDRWCDATRRALDNSLSTLFVLSHQLEAGEMAELSKMIAFRCAHKPHLILPAPTGDNDDHWTGDEKVWTRHLSQFRIDPPFSVRATGQIYRLQRNVRSALRKASRPAA
jgi:hypothetical protein